MSAAVVAHGGANIFRNFVQLRDQCFNRKILKVCISFESLVEVCYVRVVMLVVVNFHGLRVNVRLECVKRVR